MDEYKDYITTVTPKYPSHNGYRDPFTVKVKARSKREANKAARKTLEREGHMFTRDDACIFSSQLAEDRA